MQTQQLLITAREEDVQHSSPAPQSDSGSGSGLTVWTALPALGFCYNKMAAAVRVQQSSPREATIQTSFRPFWFHTFISDPSFPLEACVDGVWSYKFAENMEEVKTYVPQLQENEECWLENKI